MKYDLNKAAELKYGRLPQLQKELEEEEKLAEKTEREFMREEGILSGEISIGCGETRNMTFLSRRMVTFRQVHPMVQFSIYSANQTTISFFTGNGMEQ